MHVSNILLLVSETLNTRGKQNGYDKGADDVENTTAEERSAGRIAQIFNTLSGRDLTAAEAWLFLMSLKMARLRTQLDERKDVSDTVIDLVGYCALWAEEITNEPKPAAAAKSTAEDELRKVAKILSGSDAPGEVRAVTVTAQSYVDRLAALASARTTLSAESWAHLEKIMTQPSSPARELVELIARGTMKDGAIRSAVEHATAKFICSHESYEELNPGHYRCCDCSEHLMRDDLPDYSPEAKPCQHPRIETVVGEPGSVFEFMYRCKDCGATGPALTLTNQDKAK